MIEDATVLAGLTAYYLFQEGTKIERNRQISTKNTPFLNLFQLSATKSNAEPKKQPESTANILTFY